MFDKAWQKVFVLAIVVITLWEGLLYFGPPVSWSLRKKPDVIESWCPLPEPNTLSHPAEVWEAASLFDTPEYLDQQI